MKSVIELRQERGAMVDQMKKLLDKAGDEQRALSASEASEYDRLDLAQGQLGERIQREDRTAPRGRLYAGRDGLDGILEEMRASPGPMSGRPPVGDGYAPTPAGDEPRALANTESLAAYVHSRTALPDGIRPGDISLGRAVRAMANGDWRHAQAEQRVMATTSIGAGGAVVPDTLSADVLDRIRAKARVVQAGAMTVPMATKELYIGRVAQDPTAFWKGENQPGTFSDVALERLALRARTLITLVKMSVELAEDAANASSVVENAIAASMALELDRVALRGGETAGGVEPLGVRWVDGINTEDVAGVLDGYDDFSKAYEKVQTANGPEALGLILHPRELAAIDRMRDGESRPLPPPPSWAKITRYPSTQIPITLGGGTASEAYLGDWTQLLIGMRTNLQIEVSRVAADGTSSAMKDMQVWIRAYMRADVLLAREQHFCVVLGITPA